MALGLVVIPTTTERLREQEEALESICTALRKTANELAAVNAEWKQHHDDWLAFHPRVRELKRLHDELVERRDQQAERLKTAARTAKQGTNACGIVVGYSDPKTVVYDGEVLLRLMPDVDLDVPGLIAPMVDAETFEMAVAAGKIPMEVAVQVRREVSTTKAGRVELKITEYWQG